MFRKSLHLVLIAAVCFAANAFAAGPPSPLEVGLTVTTVQPVYPETKATNLQQIDAVGSVEIGGRLRSSAVDERELNGYYHGGEGVISQNARGAYPAGPEVPPGVARS